MKKLLPILLSLLFVSHFSNGQTPQYFLTGGTSGNVFPFSQGAGGNNRVQWLYYPSNTPTAPVGFITKVYWRTSATSGNFTANDLTIRMGNTPLTAFTSNAYITGLTDVLVTPAYPFTMPASGWMGFQLQTPFFYDGSSNYIVEAGTTSNMGFTVYQNNSTPNGRIWGPSSQNFGTGLADFGFDLIPGIPCTGTPTAEIDGPSDVCKDKLFTLKFTQFYAGVTWQWEKSTDNTNWTAVTSTINPNTGWLTTSISTNTWFRCKITCTATNQSYTTQAKYISLAEFYYCYCDGSKATGGGTDIGNVKVDKLPDGGILLDNGAGTPTYSNPNANQAYSDFRKDPATPPVPIYADSVFRLYARQINAGGAMTASYAAAWLDFNRNGIFDPWEQILGKTPSAAPLVPGQVLDTFSVQADSFRYGLTGMRVKLRNGAAPTFPDIEDPCLGYADGETEDYLVEMRYNPCKGTPTAGAAEGDTSMCIGYGYVVTDTSYQKRAHGLSRTWEESGDGVAWFPIPNSANKDTLMRVFLGQPIYYRMKINCSHSGDSAYSTVLRVNNKPTYKCYCHSQSMGGPADTSDVGAFRLGDFNTNDGGGHLGNPRAFRQRQDWTDIPEFQMFVDSMYDFYVYHTMPNRNHGDAKITVFVDFNNNKQYDVPYERIYTGFTAINNFTKIGKVVIPSNVITDVPTGMRVIINNNVAPNIPSDEGCGEYISGETEDYIVRFTRRLFPESVNNVASIGNISLHPNPTTGKFTLGYSGASGKLQVRVSSVTGQQLLQRTIENIGASVSEEFDLGGHASGVYFVEVEINGTKATRRILLQ